MRGLSIQEASPTLYHFVDASPYVEQFGYFRHKNRATIELQRSIWLRPFSVRVLQPGRVFWSTTCKSQAMQDFFFDNRDQPVSLFPLYVIGSSRRTALLNTIESATRTSIFGTITRLVKRGYNHRIWCSSFISPKVTTQTNIVRS